MSRKPRNVLEMSSKTNIKSRIANFYMDDNNQVKMTGDKEKAMVFADKFSSLFIKEPENEVPRFCPRNVPSLKHVKITYDMLREVLHKLRSNKSPSPDGITQSF